MEYLLNLFRKNKENVVNYSQSELLASLLDPAMVDLARAKLSIDKLYSRIYLPLRLGDKLFPIEMKVEEGRSIFTWMPLVHNISSHYPGTDEFDILKMISTTGYQSRLAQGNPKGNKFTAVLPSNSREVNTLDNLWQTSKSEATFGDQYKILAWTSQEHPQDDFNEPQRPGASTYLHTCSPQNMDVVITLNPHLSKQERLTRELFYRSELPEMNIHFITRKS